ncbi:MAG: hypothetical protein COB02_07585 [Candidatus Cloacimonadota bacterium]|nr:MAG: hypothetical protein COB02_07585 [Candidatus Cloacimonadota bacterium]
MIFTSILKKNRRIICDFHESEHSFFDFVSFFEYAKKKAKRYKVFIIQINHGFNRDEDGISYLPLELQNKIESQKYISRYEVFPESQGQIIIHLSQNYLKEENKMSASKSDLRKLQRLLKGEEAENKITIRKQKVQTNEDSLADLEKKLELDFDEKWLKEYLNDLYETKQHKLGRKVLHFIADFSMLFSEDFDNYFHQMDQSFDIEY